MSRGQSQPRSRPMKRGLERCQNKGDFDNGEVIDVEKIEIDVVVIDDTETSYYRTRSENKIPGVVISIDDEEEVDAQHNPGNMGCSPAVEDSDSDGDCVVFVKEDNAPSNSRMKNVIPECGSSRNCYGLYVTSEVSSSNGESSGIEKSESDSSDDEDSDCEIMDGSSGSIRELWERASLRRKMAEMNPYEPEDRVSASGSNTDPETLSPETTQHKAEAENCFNESHSKCSEEVPVQQRESCNGREDPSPGINNVGGLSEDPSRILEGKNNVLGSHPDSRMCGDEPTLEHMNEAVSEKRVNSPGENAFDYWGDGTGDVEIPHRTSACDDRLQTDTYAGNDRFTFLDKGKQIPVNTTFDPSEIPNETSPQDINGPCPEKTSSDPQPCYTNEIFSEVDGLENKEKVNAKASLNSKAQHQANVGFETSSLNGNGPFSDVSGFEGKNKATKPSCNFQTQHADFSYEPSSFERDRPCADKISPSNPQPFCKNGVFHEVAGFEGEEKAMKPSCYSKAQHANVPKGDSNKPCAEKISVCNSQPCYMNQIFSEVAGLDDGEELATKPSCNSKAKHRNVNHEDTFQQKAHSNPEEPSPKETPSCNSLSENDTTKCIVNKEPEAEKELIGERERHKESDEYKRAAEEEWASRQRELQLQAEEAQRLRKRKKAESLRLLDMEKRQKQRLDEVRESQKKVEETINLKEQYRVEVRKELEKIETRYKDMASLLRGLGIHVGGGPYPLPHEVNSAYKQALLRYHPDRTSRTDIRQQVEAEETFKLITRLKEKLLPISY
ncbi:hypothetical protein J5N97_008398 [Dioscorea zingiberensis]|uniref:J domain-containing protein n=1 Tax=Dioscorea zingiberensis TaxID=325984 RepID=A0A9D5CVN5_9LILI|nr:hypothetical protein J5N97_008398 [Dioscorea zingiberensis]